VLGARWVERQQDEALAKAARNALAKIATAAPRTCATSWRNRGCGRIHGPGSPQGQPALGARGDPREHKLLDRLCRSVGRRRPSASSGRIALAFYDNKHAIVAWCDSARTSASSAPIASPDCPRPASVTRTPERLWSGLAAADGEEKRRCVGNLLTQAVSEGP